MTKEDVMSRLDELHTVLDNLSRELGIPSPHNEQTETAEVAKNNGETADNQTTSTFKESTSPSET